MRFQVPQFIEFEDKIFGPLTLKQFIYLAGSVGMAAVLFSLLPKFIAVIFAVPIIIFGVALAFYKVNNRPFIVMVESFFKYMKSKKLYIWNKKSKEVRNTEFGPREKSELYVPKLSDSKLKDLTWSLDVKEQANPVTQDRTGDSVGI